MSLTEGYCDIIAAAEPRHHPGQSGCDPPVITDENFTIYNSYHI